jgi:phosphatidylserine/phosphatidylglycerophosphate/cardiolipin synthase-like enzyme
MIMKRISAVLLIFGISAVGFFSQARGVKTLTAPQNLETCFSPDENCDQKLIGLIDSAQSTLDVAIYNITHKDIVQAIENAKARGVRVRVVVDRSEADSRGSLVARMSTDNFPLKFGKVDGIMHDKFTIVDGKALELGSFNYTLAATSRNAENQLYIYDSRVISRYQQNFEQLFSRGEYVPVGYVPKPQDQHSGSCPSPDPGH